MPQRDPPAWLEFADVASATCGLGKISLRSRNRRPYEPSVHVCVARLCVASGDFAKGLAISAISRRFLTHMAAVGSGRAVAVVGVGSAIGLAISSSAAQRAARMGMLRVGSEGESASEQSFSTREMSEMISSLVLAGAGDDGEPASSRVRFMPDRKGGTGIEAAVA